MKLTLLRPFRSCVLLINVINPRPPQFPICLPCIVRDVNATGELCCVKSLKVFLQLADNNVEGGNDDKDREKWLVIHESNYMMNTTDMAVEKINTFLERELLPVLCPGLWEVQYK